MVGGGDAPAAAGAPCCGGLLARVPIAPRYVRVVTRGGDGRQNGLATMRRDRKPCLHVAALSVVISLVVAWFTTAIFVPTIAVCRHGESDGVAMVPWATGAGCAFGAPHHMGGTGTVATVVQSVVVAIHVALVAGAFVGLIGLFLTDPGIAATPTLGAIRSTAGNDDAGPPPTPLSRPFASEGGGNQGGLAPTSQPSTPSPAATSPVEAEPPTAAAMGDGEKVPLTSTPPPLTSSAPRRAGGGGGQQFGFRRHGAWAVTPTTGERVVKMHRKWCLRCDAERAPRASHCARCDVCVDGFDHHCGVTDTCVGAGNIRVFLLFVGGLCALCDWCAFWCIAALYAGHAAARRGVVEASAIGMLCVIMVNTLQLHAGILLYGRLYVGLGVTLREHRKKGGLYPGRETATRYESSASCRCCCCGSSDSENDGDHGHVPRPFHRGVCANAAALCCPCCGPPEARYIGVDAANTC